MRFPNANRLLPSFPVTAAALCMVGLMSFARPATSQVMTVPVLTPGETLASEVVDRSTLKSFVRGAKAAYAAAISEVGFERHGEVLEAFRIEDGIWRQGNIYLYITDTEGTITFHGANPALEGVNLIQQTDLNGVHYVQELIDAARMGGGFVEYYFDDPTVSGDEEFGSPKVGYTELTIVDGRELIVGSGIYPDLSDYVLEIALTATPDALTEDGGVQTVTVTASLSSAPIQVSSAIDLTLSGTAGGDDYRPAGDQRIVIPAEATTGSTELIFTVVNDTVYESGGETIVVAARYRDRDLGSATIAVADSYDAPGGDRRSEAVNAGSGSVQDARRGCAVQRHRPEFLRLLIG